MNQESAPDARTVLFVITKATRGGAQRYILDLTRNLPSTYRPVVAYGVAGTLSEKLAERAVPLYPLPSLGRDVAILSDIAAFFALWRLMRRERPDVVHLNSSKAAALGALAARLAGISRIIFTVHGWPFKEDRSRLARVLIYLVSYFTALLSHSIIVVSAEDARLARAMWGVARKVSHIPLAIEPPLFFDRSEAEAMLREVAGNLDARLRIVSIGELTKNKGYASALEAMALLKADGVQYSYTIFSDGEEEAALNARARALGLERVRFAGFLEDAARYLKAFDVFLLPSLKEGMPYVLLEAAAATLPIVATDAVDEGLLSITDNVRIAPRGDAGALAEALKASTLACERELFPRSTRSLSQMASETVALY